MRLLYGPAIAEAAPANAKRALAKILWNVFTMISKRWSLSGDGRPS
jgi:hypothetical protein